MSRSSACADVLIHRIQMAADVVCGDRRGPQGIAERYSVRVCEIEATEYAIEDVGHPMVMGRYYGYTTGSRRRELLGSRSRLRSEASILTRGRGALLATGGRARSHFRTRHLASRSYIATCDDGVDA